MKSKLFPPRRDMGLDYGESKIYKVEDGIYKEFAINISLLRRRRKKERLMYLEQYEIFRQYYPEIKYFVEFVKNWYIQGYVMEESPYLCLDSGIDFDKKIASLMKVREILAMLRNIGLYYYDLHLGNVGLSKKTGLPILFDIDSILYEDETKPDIKPVGFREYKKSGGKLSEEFQRIKFNVITSEALCHNRKIDFEYDEVGKEMLSSLEAKFQPNGPFSQEYLLDHILRKTK